jgi:hypothetical protein
MPDYSQGKIYTLRSYEKPDLIYVGSTTQSLGMRISKHRSDYKVYKNGKRLFVTSFKLFDECVDVYIELHEVCPCGNKDELHRREGEVIRSMDCVNRCIAGRDGKQYRVEHKDNKREYDIMYREQNKEALKDKSREYYEKNREVVKDKARMYYEVNREVQMVKHREYYQKNTHKAKQYSIDNKEKIAQLRSKRNTQQVTCCCGQTMSRSSLTVHKKRATHHKRYEALIFNFIHS